MANVFHAEEVIEIVGCERNTECSHCGRPLKVGVKLAGFSGAFGSDCLARACKTQKVGPYISKLSAEGIKTRAIVAYKGAEYASRNYGWALGGPVFKCELKSALQSI
jgi:hypothetical protein